MPYVKHGRDNRPGANAEHQFDTAPITPTLLYAA
jgi:hypothetical protein